MVWAGWPGNICTTSRAFDGWSFSIGTVASNVCALIQESNTTVWPSPLRSAVPGTKGSMSPVPIPV